MQHRDELRREEVADQNIIHNSNMVLWEALIPVIFLMFLLAYNIFFQNGEWLGAYTNQFILLLSAAVAAIIGFYNKVGVRIMIQEVWENLKSVFVPIMILFLVGALAGTWLLSGVIPAMVYYGLQILNPDIFLPASVVISAVISVATGSSWTTSATVGIALVGIGTALGIDSGMIAGAVISGAYFGDKMSPLSDTTNLAPTMAGTDLFTHIGYMTYTTIPSILITLFVFSSISGSMNTTGTADIHTLLDSIDALFVIDPILFIVPISVVVMILAKAKPLYALITGVLLAAVIAYIYQGQVLAQLGEDPLSVIIHSIFFETNIESDNATLADLFSAKGMSGMLWTIYLIISAMIFGGVMDAMGALARITASLLTMAKSTFGLFLSTVGSCLGINIVASDQYLAIVIPGKMFKNAYDERQLAPENLSRTLEDSGTVTSVLIPWNTCGAYQAEVLGVDVASYFAYAIFNYISPIMTMIFVAFRIRIRTL